jgi:hypothetical protein
MSAKVGIFLDITKKAARWRLFLWSVAGTTLNTDFFFNATQPQQVLQLVDIIDY